MKNTLILLLLLPFYLQAQQWRGKITDSKKEPIPFVNVFFEGTTVGTNSNLNGEFVIEQPNGLKSPILVVQSVGFERQKLVLTGKDPSQALRISLVEQTLKEVVVAGYKRDPAYYIIKQAQKKRKFNRDRVQRYACDIYMKGTTRLVEKPKELPGLLKLTVGEDAKTEIDSIKTGVLYFQESVAKVQYDQEKGFYEEMIASKVSGQGQAFSWNRAQEVLVSFYEDRIMRSLNERGFVSPIASDALLYYDYKLLGTFEEEGKKINKIQVIPKRKSDPIYNGEIFIVEDLWSIHSIDLTISKQAQIEFVDSIKINQIFAETQPTLYLPLSLQMSYFFGLFGFRATYEALGAISNYQLDSIPPVRTKKNEVFKVENNANKQDSAYWNALRPVVLDAEEAENLQKGDSLLTIRSSKTYLDSLDSLSNTFRWRNVILGSWDYRNRYDSINYTVPGLLGNLEYQSVDGLVLQFKPRKYRETAKGGIQQRFNLRYGTASQNLGASYRYQKQYNRYNYFTHFVELGRNTFQINENTPAPELINSLYNLIDGKNYNQYFQKSFVGTGISTEIINGVQLAASAEVAYRQNRYNSTTYNFNKRRLLFAENVGAVQSDDADLQRGNAILKTKVGLLFTINQKYASYPNRKVNYGSRYPKIGLNFTLGLLPSQNGEAAGNWHLAEVRIFDEVRLGGIGTADYQVQLGSFLGRSPRHFIDYKHFAGNQTVSLRRENSAFQSLPYYSYSANQVYLEAHYEHRFYGFFLNKIPLIKKLKWQETAGINFLASDKNATYTEVYAGINNVFRFFAVQFVSYYQAGEKLKPALRLGLRIN